MIKSHTCLVIYQGYWFKIKTDSVFAEWSFSVLLSSWAVFSFFSVRANITKSPLKASENSVIFLTSVACLLTCSLLSQGSPVHQDPDFLCLSLPAVSSWPYSSFPGSVWLAGSRERSAFPFFFKTLPERVQKSGQSRLATFLMTTQPYQCIPSLRTTCSAVSAVCPRVQHIAMGTPSCALNYLM